MKDAAHRNITTHIGTLTADTVTVRGRNLVDELIGKVNIGDLFFLEVTGKMPSQAESILVNAMMVSIAEHGMMPSNVAARLTLLSAPESLQGAVASGLLGVGDTFVGPSSNVARILQVDAAKLSGDRDEVARQIVEQHASAGRRIPGLGHPHHPVDPRAERLIELQRELHVPDHFMQLMLSIRTHACHRLGKELTFNAVASVGALASDLGIDWRAVRGIGLVARAVSLVGHLLEEMKEPAANIIWEHIQSITTYTD